MSDRSFSRTCYGALEFTGSVGGLLSYEKQFKLTFGEEAFTGDFHQALLYRGFLLSILLFGVGYYLVSRDTSQNRGIVWLGAVGKVLVFGFFTDAFLEGHATVSRLGRYINRRLSLDVAVRLVPLSNQGRRPCISNLVG